MKKEKQILITLLGCLLAVVMVCAQLFTYLHSPEKAKKAAKTEQQSQENTDEAIVMASFSLPAPIHVELNLDPHVLFEIVYEDDGEEQSTTIAPSLAAQKLLTTLLEVIISPNAP